jgi:predicted nucleotidyltransferase
MSVIQVVDSGALDDLIAELQAEKEILAERYAIRSLGIFGSYVRGEAQTTSDLDILVDFETPPTLFEFVRLQDELSERLGMPVDLVMKSALKPIIGAQILKEVILV